MAGRSTWAGPRSLARGDGWSGGAAATDLCGRGPLPLGITKKKGAYGGNMVSAVLNQLLRIEEELGDDAVYPGWDAFPRTKR